MRADSRIYLAGHTGLVGSALLKRFTQGGFKNILLASRKKLDLTIQSQVNAFFERERPEYVVLAAGKVGGILDNASHPYDFIKTNLSIQTNVLSAAAEFGAKKLLYFGSSCMYPRECAQPMSEKFLFTGVPERTSLAYATAKLAGVQTCLAFNQQFGEARFIPVIPSSVYGPNDDFDPQSSHVLSGLIRKFHDAKLQSHTAVTLWGTGEPHREFIYTDDLADAAVALLSKKDVLSDSPINIGVGYDISIKELADLVAQVVDYSGSIEWDHSKPDGAQKKLLDSRCIKKIGWSPKVPISVGVRLTYEWYLSSLKKY